MVLFSTRRPLARFDDPFLAFSRTLQRTVDEALSSPALPVRLDVKEDEKSYTVIADLPGLSEKDVEVTFDEGILSIRGEKKIARDEKGDTWHLSERSHGSFARQLSLTADIKTDEIAAKFDKGVLTITLPKEAEAQKTARKIEIKAG